MLNTFCPSRGLNQDLLRNSQTLYRAAIKAGLLPLPHIPLHFWFVPESQLDIPRIFFRHGCAPSHRMGNFTLGAKCNRWKNAKHLFSWRRIEPGSLAWQSDTIPRRYKSLLVPQGSTSVYYTCHYHRYSRVRTKVYHHVLARCSPCARDKS